MMMDAGLALDPADFGKICCSSSSSTCCLTQTPLPQAQNPHRCMLVNFN